MKKLAVLASALIVSALALAACGGGSDNSSTTASSTSSSTAAQGGGETVKVSADPTELAFQQKSLQAKAGSVTFDFSNPSTTGHDFTIEDQSGKKIAATDIITSSSTSTTADLKPGNYTFLCTVPGHAQAGMEGTLTVK